MAFQIALGVGLGIYLGYLLIRLFSYDWRSASLG
jgi:hypothetical protein